MLRVIQKVVSSSSGLLKFDKVTLWLECSPTASQDTRYQHSLLKEINGQRAVIIDDLKLLIQRAHDDARKMLRSLADYNLDPLGSANTSDPARGYPEQLDIQVLKSYIGEIFAGIFAESYSPFGQHWRVPAPLFRFHNVAFDQLERWRQTGNPPGPIPGRTGDDNLAFQFDDSGRIVSTLFCEAKCTASHKASMIEEAHQQISAPDLKPIELLRLIKLFSDYDDESSNKWINALRQLYFQDLDPVSYERLDLVCYVCGKSPVQGNRTTWMSTSQPHTEYTGMRRLQAVEIHLQGIDAFVKEVYNKT